MIAIFQRVRKVDDSPLGRCIARAYSGKVSVLHGMNRGERYHRLHQEPTRLSSNQDSLQSIFWTNAASSAIERSCN